MQPVLQIASREHCDRGLCAAWAVYVCVSFFLSPPVILYVVTGLPHTRCGIVQTL